MQISMFIKTLKQVNDSIPHRVYILTGFKAATNGSYVLTYLFVCVCVNNITPNVSMDFDKSEMIMSKFLTSETAHQSW